MKTAASFLIAIVMAVSAIGCQSSKPQARPAASVDLKNDPCAERLHEISGLLLQYYALYRRLPENLELLHSLETGDVKLVMSCPVSGKPYIYNSRGLSVTPTGSMRMVVYDSTPAHDGMRWAVAVVEPNGAGPLSTSVRAVPESAIPQPPDTKN